MKRSTLAALALSTLAVTACHQEPPKVEAPPKLPVTSPQRRATEFTREYVAQVHAHQHIEVRALERGYLQGIYVDEGQRVTRGQRMFQLLPVIYQAEVQEAEAEAERAGIEYDNTRSLADKNVVSPQELALAGASRAKARAKLKLAATHQSLTQVNAPFSGTMGRFQARLGSLIGEGDLLTTLSDTSKMWVYFNVSEREYLDLKAESPDLKGRPVRLQLANGKLFDRPGTIETIDSDFDNETGTIAFRAGFSNPDGLLRHGETGKILLSSNVPDALIIPQKATFEVMDKKFVFVVDGSHHVHSRPITVTAELPQLYVVGSGLTEQEHVLVEGLRRVREGSAIEPDVRPPGDVLEHLDVTAE